MDNLCYWIIAIRIGDRTIENPVVDTHTNMNILFLIKVTVGKRSKKIFFSIDDVTSPEYLYGKKMKVDHYIIP